MRDDADVLWLRGRAERSGSWESDLDDALSPDRADRDQRYDEPLGYPVSGVLGARTDELTRVVLVGDRVVDVVRGPVRGTDYECAALEIEDEVRRRSAPPPPEPPGYELQLAWLTRVVGGDQALAALTDRPLPPEPLSLTGVPERLHERARAVEGRLTGPAGELLGEEGLTAVRRLLTMVLATVPGALVRSDRDDTAAGGLVWAVAKGNDLVGQGRPVRAKAVQDAFGLSSSPGSRGSAFAHAVGGGAGEYGWSGYYRRQWPDVVPLGSPSLLLGGFRRRLVVQRDLALRLREASAAP